MRLALAVLFLTLSPVPGAAQLRVLETSDLRLVYLAPSQSYLVPHVARCFENSMRFQHRLLRYTPQEKVTVILNDFADYGNAGAGANPRTGLMVMIAPMNYAYETYPANERINTLMNHELVHIAAFDRPTGRDRFFRHLFAGKVKETAEQPESILYAWLTIPRTSAPRWFHEGIAVFIETWMAGGIGRAQGAYDEMVFRSKVLDDAPFYDPLGLVSEGTKVDFQVEMNSYLYGTRFVTWLAYAWDPETLLRWIRREKGTKAYFASQFERVFGLSLEAAWHQWIAWEHEFQRTNLDSIRKFPTTPYRDLSDRALGSISRAWLDVDTQRLYAALNYPGVVSHLAAISLVDGTVQPLLEIKGPTMYSVASTAWDPGRRTLFYTTDNADWRDLRALDVDRGTSRTLVRDARIGDLVYDATHRALWGIRHYNGIATLVLVPEPYDSWRQIHSWPYGQVPYDLDVSPDGSRLAASVAEVSGRHALHLFDVDSLLAGGRLHDVASLDLGDALPANFVFSRDGQFLYGSSYITGVSNIFRWHPATDSLEAISNCETGFFRPLPLSEDSLVIFRYSGQGFVPARIAVEHVEDVSAITFLGQRLVERHPILKQWRVSPPSSVALDSLVTHEGKYVGLASLEVESVYPITESYKNLPAYGLRLNLSDPLAMHRISWTVSGNPQRSLPADERVHAEFDWQRYDWGFHATWNDADFYDHFGPTKTSRRGWSAGLSYKKTLLDDRPRRLRVQVGVTGYGRLERLPDAQNVRASFDRLLATRARLDYRNRRFSLGAVDYEKGVEWTLASTANIVRGEAFPLLHGDLHVGMPVPGVRHASVWLRNAAGWSPGDRNEPFANFYFGGFGNNWVDHLAEKRYREHYAFPGIDLNRASGTTFVKTLLDFNMPPLRFTKLGSPGLYATWARASVFGGALVTNVDHAGLRRTWTHLGSQVDVRLTLLSHLRMTLSFGYAVAFEGNEKPQDEVMVSLKVL